MNKATIDKDGFLNVLTTDIKGENILSKAMQNSFKPLSIFEKLCVLVDLSGLFPSESEFSQFIEKSVVFLGNLRNHPEYSEIAVNLALSKQQQNAQEVEDPEELLNREIVKSIQALVEIRDDSGLKAGERLKAISEILDRAPKAPRQIRKDEEVPRVILQIPFSQVETLKQVAHEENDADLIELFENEDFTSEIDND